MLHNLDLADCTLVLAGDGGGDGGGGAAASAPRECMAVHWFVLYSQSEYWKAMFRAGMQEARQMEVVIEDVAPAVMRDVVRFLYTGEIALCELNAHDVLVAAVRYQIGALTHVAEAFISRHICAENALDVLRTAAEHGCARLKAACVAFLLRHLPELIARDAAEPLDEPTIEAVLAMLRDVLSAHPPAPAAKRPRLGAHSRERT